MGEEHLIKITTTEQAKKLGKKGGQARTLAKKMINRKFCTSTCPLFNNCWAKHISHSLKDKAIEKAKEEGVSEKEIKKIKPLCALKKMPSQVIEGTKRIILGGEEGFNQEMMEQVMKLKNDIIINASPRDRERYLHQLRETKKSIYGDKSRIEGIPKNNIITAADFAEAYDISKKNKEKKEVDTNE